jgi:hypothetical protein
MCDSKHGDRRKPSESCRRAGDRWALGIGALPAGGPAYPPTDSSTMLRSCCRKRSRRVDRLGRHTRGRVVRGRVRSARGGTGHAETACRLWGAADGLLDGLGGSLNPEVGWIRDQYITRTQARWRRPLCGDFRARAAPVARSVVGLIEAARTDTLVRASDGGAELPGSHGPRPFLPLVSNVEQNLQNDVDFQQARSSSQ